MAMTFQEMLPIIRNVTIFAGIAEDNVRRIVGECTTSTHGPGEVIIREGTPASNIYVVLKGKVKVVLNIDEEPLEVCEFGPGHCLGETSVIGITSHSASVVVIQETVLLEISRQTLMHVYDNDKGFFSLLILNIARELARRLHRTDDILLQYAREQERWMKR